MNDRFNELRKSIIEAIEDEDTSDKERVNFNFNNATTGVKKSYLKRLKDPVKYVLNNYARVSRNQLKKSTDKGNFSQSIGIIKLLESGDLIKVSEAKYYKDLIRSKRQDLDRFKMTDEEKELQRELLKLGVMDWGQNIREKSFEKKEKYNVLSSYTKGSISTIIY